MTYKNVIYLLGPEEGQDLESHVTKIISCSLSLLALLAACGGDKLVLPSDGAPAAIVIVEGNEQTGRVGAALASPLVVAVTDTRGRPVEGAAVTFTFNGGTGSDATPSTTTTDANGHASTELKLGTAVGGVQGVAKVAGSEGSTPQVEFSAVAVPASASEIAMVSGNNQSGQVGTKLSQRLVVGVTDAFGNPNEGVEITWTVTGGGSVSSATTVTGANGQTSVERTLGSATATQTTRATAAGLVGSPVVFTHSPTASDAERVTVVSGINQTVVVGSRLPNDLVVLVLDANDNPVPGATVSWVVEPGNGSVESASTTTGANGRTSTKWTLGLLPGTYELEAQVDGATSAAFTATATIGPSASLVVIQQPAADAVVNVTLAQAPIVQLRDVLGNAVSQGGVSVTAAIASGDGTLAGTATRTTNGSGQATFANLRITGATGPHTLIFAATNHTSVSSNVIEVAKAATTVTVTSVAPSPSTAGQQVNVGWTVTSAAGTPTGTVTVTASGGTETCSASVAAGSCSLALTTTGVRVLTATYGGAELFNGNSDTETHTVQAANGAPVANVDAYTTAEDVLLTASVSVLANDTDPEDQLLSAQLLTDVQHGTLTLNGNGTFTYQPSAGFHGNDTFTYRATDGALLSNTATVTITVQSVNDAPSLTLLGDQNVVVDAGPQAVSGFAQATDFGAGDEPQTIEAFEVEVTNGGLFAVEPTISPTGELTYTPGSTPGEASVSVRVRDSGGTTNGGQNRSDAQTFKIIIAPSP